VLFDRRAVALVAGEDLQLPIERGDFLGDEDGGVALGGNRCFRFGVGQLFGLVLAITRV
jgi:hypothetical protein